MYWKQRENNVWGDCSELIFQMTIQYDILLQTYVYKPSGFHMMECLINTLHKNGVCSNHRSILYWGHFKYWVVHIYFKLFEPKFVSVCSNTIILCLTKICKNIVFFWAHTYLTRYRGVCSKRGIIFSLFFFHMSKLLFVVLWHFAVWPLYSLK